MTNLTENDLVGIGDSPITIRSAHFANVYLRMDGSGVTTQTANGGGTVNCAPGVGTHQEFRLWRQGDGSYSVESVAYPNVYLRMTAKGFTAQAAQGGGLVNCQFNARGGSDEKFRLRPQPDGSFSIESTSFANVFMRMDGSGVTAAPGGTVNCQFNGNGGPYERFLLSRVGEEAVLDFEGQPQQRTNWCWAAGTISVEHFYRPNSQWTQCRLATEEYARRGVQVECCPPPPMPGAGNDNGNQGSWPDRPMQIVGLAYRQFPNALTAAETNVQMTQGRPIVVDLHWRQADGSLWPGHIVVIYGYRTVAGENRVVVYDPGNGGSVQNVSYEDFRLRYQGSGVWVNSYTTQP